MTRVRGAHVTLQYESLPSGSSYSSINYTNSLLINICHHVSGPVLFIWDITETKTNIALILMVPTVKNEKLANHD